MDASPLYPNIRQVGGGLDFADVITYINSSLSEVDDYFKQNDLKWPRIGEGVRDQTNTMAGGVASRLVDESGVGTYMGVVQRLGGGGHVTVVSVHEGKQGYRIYTHDFQFFLQYEGLPRFLGTATSCDVRDAYHYSFIKVSDTPFPLDPSASSIPWTGLVNIPNLIKARGVSISPLPDRGGI